MIDVLIIASAGAAAWHFGSQALRTWLRGPSDRPSNDPLSPGRPGPRGAEYAAAVAKHYAAATAAASPTATKASKQEPPPSYRFEVLFFPDGKLPCRNAARPGGCRRGPSCTYSHDPTSLTRFLRHLESAKQSLLICVFTITADDISDAILAAHQRGVKIRIITDNDQAVTNGSDISKFQAAGIPLRMDKEASHMHHKFCIIDGRIIMNGSFNWTRQAVLANQENIVIQEHPGLVKEFISRFEYMWKLYE